MRYRKLDGEGDYTFGKGSGNFLSNTPETVAQSVKTRLGLIQGEWFLDISQGTPYNSQVLGRGKLSTYDAAIKQVILETPGVLRISAYYSGVDPLTRGAQISATIDTIYGQAEIQTSL